MTPTPPSAGSMTAPRPTSAQVGNPPPPPRSWLDVLLERHALGANRVLLDPWAHLSPLRLPPSPDMAAPPPTAKRPASSQTGTLGPGTATTAGQSRARQDLAARHRWAGSHACGAASPHVAGMLCTVQRPQPVRLEQVSRSHRGFHPKGTKWSRRTRPQRTGKCMLESQKILRVGQATSTGRAPLPVAGRHGGPRQPRVQLPGDRPDDAGSEGTVEDGAAVAEGREPARQGDGASAPGAECRGVAGRPLTSPDRHPGS